MQRKLRFSRIFLGRRSGMTFDLEIKNLRGLRELPMGGYSVFAKKLAAERIDAKREVTQGLVYSLCVRMQCTTYEPLFNWKQA